LSLRFARTAMQHHALCTKAVTSWRVRGEHTFATYFVTNLMIDIRQTRETCFNNAWFYSASATPGVNTTTNPMERPNLNLRTVLPRKKFPLGFVLDRGLRRVTDGASTNREFRNSPVEGRGVPPFYYQLASHVAHDRSLYVELPNVKSFRPFVRRVRNRGWPCTPLELNRISKLPRADTTQSERAIRDSLVGADSFSILLSYLLTNATPTSIHHRTITSPRFFLFRANPRQPPGPITETEWRQYISSLFGEVGGDFEAAKTTCLGFYLCAMNEHGSWVCQCPRFYKSVVACEHTLAAKHLTAGSDFLGTMLSDIRRRSGVQNRPTTLMRRANVHFDLRLEPGRVNGRQLLLEGSCCTVTRPIYTSHGMRWLCQSMTTAAELSQTDLLHALADYVDQQRRSQTSRRISARDDVEIVFNRDLVGFVDVLNTSGMASMFTANELMTAGARWLQEQLDSQSSRRTVRVHDIVDEVTSTSTVGSKEDHDDFWTLDPLESTNDAEEAKTNDEVPAGAEETKTNDTSFVDLTNDVSITTSHVICKVDFIEITERNLNSLQDGKWLDDNIIDCWLHRTREDSPIGTRVFVYNASFHRKLQNNGYNGVCRWTQDTNVFLFEALVIQINFNGHWSLCIVQFDESTIVISHLDSANKGFHNTRAIFRRISRYLSAEYRTVYSKIDHRRVELQMPDVPQQENGNDCGVFVLLYATEFFRKMTIPVAMRDRASQSDCAHLRHKIRRTIDALSKEQSRLGAHNKDGEEGYWCRPPKRKGRKRRRK